MGSVSKRWLCLTAVCAALTGAGETHAEQPPEPPLRAEEAAGRSLQSPELKLNPRTLASLDQPIAENLPKIDGGTIPRVVLEAELKRGIGAFLGQVRTKPAARNGRFVGWRVIELFKKRADVHVRGLKAGDTVVKVNGHSLEHPEQFKVAWDSVAKAAELVIEIERQGRRSQLRYTIIGLR